MTINISELPIKEIAARPGFEGKIGTALENHDIIVQRNDSGHFYLEFRERGKPELQQRNYLFHFTAIPSNLGKGEVWYFVCPCTRKKCRILYLWGNSTVFAHRSAYPETTLLHTKEVRRLPRTMALLDRQRAGL